MGVIRASELASVETPGGNTTAPITTRARGATEISLIWQRQVSGASIGLHTDDREEVLVLTRGRLTVTAGDEQATLEPGDVVIVPANMPHELANAGNGPAEWFLVAPAGRRYFTPDGQEWTPPWSE